MSNFLAIATVTAALSEVLSEALVGDVGGASVTTLRPDGNGNGMPSPGVNVFLYQVTPNAAWQNADLPTRRPNGELTQRPQVALDLQYLLTFYGDEAQLQPQRVLGSAVRSLHARPVLTRAVIRDTISKVKYGFLANSNLADSVELVKFTPVPLSLEDLSKLWSVYFQTPYSLSVAYQGTVIFIESEESTQAALPVRARNIYGVPFRQPVIEQIRSEEGKEAFITSSSTIVIKGKRLRGEALEITVGGIPATEISEASDTQITLKLPAGLQAGVQGLAVAQPMLIGTPPAPHRGVESNLAAFVLHPTIIKEDDEPEITVEPENVTVKLSPDVGRSQRASLLMNQINPPINQTPRAYSFDAAPRDDDEPVDTLTFPISGVAAGDYLVRVQVDGASSALEQSNDENNPGFTGPQVEIP